MNIDREAFERTRRNAIERLLSERDERGVWVGELSSSALSTATAITTFHLYDPRKFEGRIAAGVEWLLLNQNADGGWGDTDKSFSNISTTTLCWAALGLIGGDGQSIARAEAWLAKAAGSMEPAILVEAIMQRYGKDRTFSVPILTMATLCERFGPREDAASWRWVKQLPFEMAALPQSWYRRVNLQVVSYALPALIAIGQVRHHHRPTWNPITRLLRWMTKRKTFEVLRRIQPSSGGYLEATPLTSFVCMSLAGMGEAITPDAREVLAEGVAFLEASQRGDGSWAIDSNLATWVTTLSVNALAGGGRLDDYLNEDERGRIRDWLLDQQYTEVHPFTGAEPGGWAWTDLPGGVPDADDTSGAILAIVNLCEEDDPAIDAAFEGKTWLCGIQNKDGGMPTFCRGWGRLPFDRSSPDITGHFKYAARKLHRVMDARKAADWDGRYIWPITIPSGDTEAENYLEQTGGAHGEFAALWFGNQHAPDDRNLVYGTTRAGRLTLGFRKRFPWVLSQQNDDGGWGGELGAPSSIEETAIAIDFLVGWPNMMHAYGDRATDAVNRGVAWLIERTDNGVSFESSPIGFYFAKLWYYEKLYPIIWTVEALERTARYQDDAATEGETPPRGVRD